MNPIIMVDRGDCHFVQKVRNIQNMGVHLAVIVDNKDEHSENLVMADDGSGWSITIPSFFIRKNAGKLIKDEIETGTKDYAKAELEITHPDNRVEYELWYSTFLDVDYWRLYDMMLF